MVSVPIWLIETYVVGGFAFSLLFILVMFRQARTPYQKHVMIFSCLTVGVMWPILAVMLFIGPPRRAFKEKTSRSKEDR